MPLHRRRSTRKRKSRSIRNRRKQKGGAFDENVLYLGMAVDVMPVFYLVPNFTHLYAIDAVSDTVFAGDSETMKECIIIQLATGGDVGCYKHFHLRKQEDGTEIFRTLPEPATNIKILEDTHDLWKIQFDWRGKTRFLTYYFHREFVTTDWPEEIKDIGHLMWMGTFRLKYLHSPDEYDENDTNKLIKMIESRCITPTIYEQDYGVESLPEKIEIPTSYDNKSGRKIAFKKIESFEGKWYEI